MKRLTILFLALSLVLAGVMLWQWTHVELSVAARSVRTVPAEEMKSNYEAVRRAVTNGSLQGVVYHAEALREAEACSFQFFILSLENRGLLPAEMTELQLTPFSQDICAYLSRQEVVIPPGGKKDVVLTLLTAGASPTVRDVTVTYYLWGHLYRQKLTLNRLDYIAEAKPVLQKVLSFLFPSASAEESALPEGFVYVKDLIPDCIEQMRYAGEENFVGAVVDGCRFETNDFRAWATAHGVTSFVNAWLDLPLILVVLRELYDALDRRLCVVSVLCVSESERAGRVSVYENVVGRHVDVRND